MPVDSPIIATRANPIFKVMKPIYTSNNNFPLHNIRYKLEDSMAVQTYSMIFHTTNRAS
ncbi:hypothetical protein Hanom_Chr17g01533641 [Helianthus anomalus]